MKRDSKKRKRKKKRKKNRKKKRKKKRKRKGEKKRKRKRKIKRQENRKIKEKRKRKIKKGCFCKMFFFLLLPPGSALEKIAGSVNPGNKPTKVNWALSWPSALEMCGKAIL
jgi:hypothetical protein